MCVVSFINETQPTVPFWLFLPSRLHLSYLSRDRPPPTFWLSFRPLCGYLQVYIPPSLIVTHNICYPVFRHIPHNKSCHTPSPSPLSFPPPSMTVHGPTWCRGRLRSTGLRALYSPNRMISVSYSACATTQSGLSSTLLQEGRCGTDQSSLPRLPWVPVLIFLKFKFKIWNKFKILRNSAQNTKLYLRVHFPHVRAA